MYLSASLKQKWADLLLGDFTPHDIALGLAWGTFIALLPTFGFSILLALLFSFMFPHINRPAIIVALIVWNPLVQIPIYAASFQIGSLLFEGMPVVKYNIEVLNQFYTFTRRFLVAHLAITFTLSLFTYLSSRLVLKHFIVRRQPN